MKPHNEALSPALPSPYRQRRFLIFGGLYILLWIATWYSSQLLQHMGSVSLWFLPSGLRFFCLLVLGWPGVVLELAVQFIFALMQITSVAGTPITDVLSTNTLWRLFNLLGSLVANAIVILPLRRSMLAPWDIARPKHWVLVLVAALVTCTLSGLVGTFGIVQLGFIKQAQFAEVFPSWAIGDFLGIITLTPLLLVRAWPGLRYYLQRERRHALSKSIEANVFADRYTLMLVVPTLLLVFGIPWYLGLNAHLPLIALLLLLPLVAVALHGGLRSTVLAVMLLDGGLVLLIALFDQHGQALHYQLVMIAIVLVGVWLGGSIERIKTAEAAKHESEASLRATFEQAAVGIATVALDGRWLRANQKVCEITGYSLDEILSKTFQEITYPEDSNRDRDTVQKLLAGDNATYSLEKRYIRKDGALIWVKVTGSLVRRLDGRPDYFVAVIEDFQSRKQSEDALRVSEHVLKEAQRLSRVGNWRWDLRTGQHIWSEEIYRIYGHAETLPPLCYPEVQVYYTPASWARISTAVETSLALRTPLLCEAEIVCPNGMRRWITCRAEVTCDAAGKALELHGTLQDITELKQAEESLRELNSALEQRVAERTQEIVSLNVELKAKASDAESANQAKSKFLSTVSHEIRTPLNAVVGLTGLLADSPMTRRQREYAEKIQLAAQTLRVLIDDILDFSKIEAGALCLEQAPFSLAATLRIVAAIISVGTSGKPIEALFDVERDIPDQLIGDPLRLQQILVNLAGNAAKFTEKGEIVVTVRCLARDAGQATLEFSVRDTGIGIPAEQLENIFEVFTQAEVSTGRQYGGTGLGLAISARLAALMGCRIAISSVVGQGSEFSFALTLPLANDAPQVSPETTLAGLRVLIIEDHPLARAILTEACAAFGWRATALDSAAAGLAELRRNSAENYDYDLVLVDWRMPDMDGIEMLRQAQAAPEIVLPLVVLMVSTVELEQAIAASDDLYIDGLMSKPIMLTSLFDTVTRTYAGEQVSLLPLPHNSSARLSDMRILVAEDNDLNQLVVEQMLTQAGAEVVMVNNGQAAVEAVRAPKASFHAVLMDIKMPLMDGYTATRIIREEMGLIDLPIIAVTAHAQFADREMSRLAGMVGHIVKPIDVESLLDILADGIRQVPGLPDESPARVAEAKQPAIQLPGIDIIAALKAFGGNEKKYGGVLRQFVVGHGGDIAEARRLFSAGDQKGAATLVHDLRGMSSIVRAMDMANLAAAIECAIGKPEAVPSLFDELQLAMNVVNESIDQIDAMATGR